MLICRDIDFLMPKFAEKVMAAIDQCHAYGYEIYIYETWRAPMRQNMLMKKNDGTTNASAWHSFHQYGLAMDFAYGGPKKWNWPDNNHSVAWEKPAQIFIEHGMDWGGPADAGHIQWATTYKHGDLFALHQKVGILGIWDLLQNS